VKATRQRSPEGRGKPEAGDTGQDMEWMPLTS
jgi:hypothetical protein